MIAEKAERQRAAFMSCAQEMTKLRMTSVVMGSAVATLMTLGLRRLAGELEMAARDEASLPGRRQKRGRRRLFHDGRAGNDLPHLDLVPLDNGRLPVPAPQ